MAIAPRGNCDGESRCDMPDARPDIWVNQETMMQRTKSIALGLGVVAFALTQSSCGGAIPGTGKAGKVDPNTCGSYASSEAGARVKAFLESTVELEAAVLNAENYLVDTCKEMGSALGISPAGDNTQAVCNEVNVVLQQHLEVGVKAEAKLEVNYKPAVCSVNLDVAAEVAAECEGKATADMQVTCEGQCSGTCKGDCSGNCEGSAGTEGSGGDCNGQCSGVCKGECSAGCDGSADVDASVSCRAKANVRANVEAKCEPPEVEVVAEAGIIVDTSKVEAAKKAIEIGLGRLLAIERRAARPLKTAMAGWLGATAEMSAEVGSAAKTFGKQSLCVAGQLKAALDLKSKLKASIDVQIEVSASVSASAGGGASGGAGGGAGAEAGAEAGN